MALILNVPHGCLAQIPSDKLQQAELVYERIQPRLWVVHKWRWGPNNGLAFVDHIRDMIRITLAESRNPVHRRFG